MREVNNIGKYEEKIYERFEGQFSSVKSMIKYLDSFGEKSNNAYELDAVRVANELQTSLDITQEAQSAKSLDNLRELSSRARKLKFNQGEPLGIINERIVLLEEKEDQERNKEEENARRRQAYTERQLAEQIARDEKNAERLAEEAIARREELEERKRQGELKRQEKQEQRIRIRETGEGESPDF